MEKKTKTTDMIRTNFIFSLIFISLIISCNKDDSQETINQDSISNFNSQICQNITGPKAIFWDAANGLAVPLNQVPILDNVSGQFIHSQLPYLGFPMPTGYSATEIYDPTTQAIGVNVIRNDNNVVWRYIPTITFVGNISETDIIAFEINQIMNFHNSVVTPQVLCTETRNVPNSGFEVNFTARLINFGNFTATVTVQTYYFADLDRTFASISVISGPKNEYDNLIMNIFLPLSWQLIIGPEGVQDSDLDGYPDGQDAEPLDPNIH